MKRFDRLVLTKVLTLSLFLVFVIGAVVVPVRAFDMYTNVTVSLNVNDTVLVVRGWSFPDALVTIRNQSSVVGTVSSGSDGYFEKTFPAQNPGLHDLEIFAEDPTSAQVTDTVSQNISVANQATTTVTFFLPTTLILPDNEPVQDGAIRFRGRTKPGATVTLVLDEERALQAGADNDGNWQIDINVDTLGVGRHSVYAVVNDSLGNQSTPTALRYFIVSAAPGEVIVEGEGAATPLSDVLVPSTAGGDDAGERDAVDEFSIPPPLRPVANMIGINDPVYPIIRPLVVLGGIALLTGTALDGALFGWRTTRRITAAIRRFLKLPS